MYIKLPKIIEEDETMVYKLVKPLYGLTDAGRCFWKKVKKIFKENEYETTLGDECFYRKYQKDGSLAGMCLTHVDDFVINGTEEFVNETVELMKRELTISKVVKNEFRFCGLDLCQKDGKIELSMNEYADNMFLAQFLPKQRIMPN